VSSFQRNKSGRYLFYKLANLTTGEHQHVAVLDRSLLGGWPIPPRGHRFLEHPDQAASGSHSPLSLRYDANEFCKEAAAYRAAYRNDDFALELKLYPQGPPLPVCGTGLTGVEKPEDQHYYSYPRLSAEANLRRDGVHQKLEGIFWYDHQWGKTATGTLMKWCWWGFQLDDGQNLNIIFLQDMRTSETVQTAITTQATDGQINVSRVINCRPKRYWISPAKKKYAVEWEIHAPELGVTISTRPMRDEHELPVLLYGQIWEGPCSVELRTADGRIVKGRGFQEMIGQGNE
jgi:predicted secreted hydrolase